MIRGVNRQRIFEEYDDYDYFIDCMSKALSHGGEVHAYCLMSNHVHLLLSETDEPVATTMKRIESRYVRWFNKKYDRVGHLFQNRYVSRCVEDDAYFLTVLTYIHLNPVTDGLCRRPEDYEWSSRASLGQSSRLVHAEGLERMVRIDSVLDAEANALRHGVELDEPLEPQTLRRHLSDAEGWSLFAEAAKVTTGAEFQQLPADLQRRVVRRTSAYMSVRQVSRLTGLGRRLVAKWVSQNV